MASLVDYEDSDSETNEDWRTELHLNQHSEDQPFVMNPLPPSSPSSSPSHQTIINPSSHQTPIMNPSPPSSHQPFIMNPSPSSPLSSPSSPSHQPFIMNPSPPSSSSSSWSMKRGHQRSCAVRPYVPKRLRASAYASAALQTEEAHSVGSQLLLSEVRGHLNTNQVRGQLSTNQVRGHLNTNQVRGQLSTNQVRGHLNTNQVRGQLNTNQVRGQLNTNQVRGQLPRRFQCGLQAHQGPVNTLQWCPVDHHSHLLLSASMDHTFKLWDGVESGRCLQTYSSLGSIRDARWLPCGGKILSGSFDGTVALTDVETSQTIVKMENQFKVGCVAPRPFDPDVFLCGGFSSEVKAWDVRSRKVLRVYKAGVQQTLAILFLADGEEFISSTDAVSRDSAELTLVAWDFGTAAKLSNQIFHERYTCPCLASHPVENSFVAQTNGDYVALFSSQRPYRMNKRRRYEGHKVEGFAVHCGFSADGTVLVSGSSTGSVHFYDFHTSRTLKTLRAHEHACVCAALHPRLPGVMASCDWGGEIKIWK